MVACKEWWRQDWVLGSLGEEEDRGERAGVGLSGVGAGFRQGVGDLYGVVGI
jgi:hypothetical protein